MAGISSSLQGGSFFHMGMSSSHQSETVAVLLMEKTYKLVHYGSIIFIIMNWKYLYQIPVIFSN